MGLPALKLRWIWMSPHCGNRLLRELVENRWRAAETTSGRGSAAQVTKSCRRDQFDEDSPIVRPESYRVVGRIADTLYHPALLPYKFLIVGHTVATGKREYNLTLSQRRADAIRDVLVTTFKISPKRLQAIGLRQGAIAGRRPSDRDDQPADPGCDGGKGALVRTLIFDNQAEDA